MDFKECLPSRLEQVKKDVYDFKYVSLKPVRVWDRMDTLDTRMSRMLA